VPELLCSPFKRIQRDVLWLSSNIMATEDQLISDLGKPSYFELLINFMSQTDTMIKLEVLKVMENFFLCASMNTILHVLSHMVNLVEAPQLLNIVLLNILLLNLEDKENHALCTAVLKVIDLLLMIGERYRSENKG